MSSLDRFRTILGDPCIGFLKSNKQIKDYSAMRYHRFTIVVIFYALSYLFFHPHGLNAQTTDVVETDPKTGLGEQRTLIDFQRDIVPILRNRCLSCHGPEDAKNDFRVDDHDVMMDFIDPGDSESSSLYADYLATDDPDMLMPPPSKGGPLSTTEIALIRFWIEEGAVWPDDGVTFSEDAESESIVSDKTEREPVRNLSSRIWIAQGFLHPATVHFPIALLTVGAFFVLLGWKWPRAGTQIPLASLLIGSLTAIVSTLMGWAFAPEQGYGDNWASLDFDSEVDMHRWSAVIVTTASTFFSIIALLSLVVKSERLTKTWKIGLLLSAAMVGAVGHQGGEMSYGKDFYPRAVRILLGQPEPEEVSFKHDSFDKQQAAYPIEDQPAAT